MSDTDEEAKIVAAQITSALAEISKLRQQVQELTAQQDLMAALVDEGLNMVTPIDELEPELDIAPPPPELRYGSLDEFVDQYVRRAYEKPGIKRSETHWHKCWPQHSQVYWSMDYLWASFGEALAGDLGSGGGSNVTTWMTSSFNPLMDRITSQEGPFRLCDPTTHTPPVLLGDDPAQDVHTLREVR